jgi:hypothetical protein
MTPDEKLLSWEYMAMSLEQEAQGHFPTISRQLLLDTYNFLALPGTQKAYDKQDRPCRKLRFYNYQLVRAVARGDLSSEESKSVICALESIKNSQKSIAFTIADRLPESTVALRLDVE